MSGLNEYFLHKVSYVSYIISFRHIEVDNHMLIIYRSQTVLCADAGLRGAPEAGAGLTAADLGDATPQLPRESRA